MQNSCALSGIPAFDAAGRSPRRSGCARAAYGLQSRPRSIRTSPARSGAFVFSALGNAVNRSWPFLLVGWVALLVALRLTAPEWNQVARDGQFSFLPDDSPSRRADELFNTAFP